jgi:hypothetical protein
MNYNNKTVVSWKSQAAGRAPCSFDTTLCMLRKYNLPCVTTPPPHQVRVFLFMLAGACSAIWGYSFGGSFGVPTGDVAEYQVGAALSPDVA